MNVMVFIQLMQKCDKLVLKRVHFTLDRKKNETEQMEAEFFNMQNRLNSIELKESQFNMKKPESIPTIAVNRVVLERSNFKIEDWCDTAVIDQLDILMGTNSSKWNLIKKVGKTMTSLKHLTLR